VAEEPRLTVDVVALPLGDYQTNCYLVAAPGASEAVVIDPGDSPDAVLRVLEERGWTGAAILVTHGHFDHLGAIAGVAAGTGAEVWMPRGEADELRTLASAPYEPEHLVDGGETLQLAGLEFKVLSVPGHSPDHVAYATDGIVFIGDLLFAGSVGRTDLEGSDEGTLLASIAAVMEALPGETVVAPGHGPATTLDRERQTNPFLETMR
jgi:glyoxylase-like metal-dependent hydrolase (beta-lactamase superfamily II)